MRILIADDDPTSCLVLKTLIEKQGHEVVMTINGMEAWQVMQQPDAPRMAILDWMMPEMDGMEVCRRIRALDTELPPHIIMVTVRGGKADIIAGFDAGADDYLAKPFDPGELSARINVGCRLIEMQNKLLAAYNDLSHEARHDPLTGILNRRAILEALSREISRQERSYSGLAVGFCDLDYFKKINDVHGHQVGDDVLCGFARLLQGALRQHDYLGRLGGDEFALISSSIRGDDVTMLYERLRAVIADNPIPTRQGNLSITGSIGVAIWSEKMTDNAMLAAADAALYAAKNKGRNCIYIKGN